MQEVIIYKLEIFNKVILSSCFPVRNTAVRSSPVPSPQVALRAGYSDSNNGPHNSSKCKSAMVLTKEGWYGTVHGS